MTPTICDALGTPIREGDEIVYAVRDGSCMAALRLGIVTAVASTEYSGHAPEYFIDVITAAGRRATLKYPDRVAVVSHVPLTDVRFNE